MSPDTQQFRSFLVRPEELAAQKAAWKLCREYLSPTEFLNEFDYQPSFIWRTDGGPSNSDHSNSNPGHNARNKNEPNRRKHSVDELSDGELSGGELIDGELTDRAYKMRLTRHDGRQCETVALFGTTRRALRRLPRATACISSQLGCAVDCPFCATGAMGLVGNLSAEEIVEQVYWAGLVAKRAGHSLRNVVFMGMGEPLHNTDAVCQAIEVLTCPLRFGLAPRKITLSTAGMPAQMLRVARQFQNVRIALSLHAANTEIRKQLVPRATSDMTQLHETIQQLNAIQDGPVWIEIVLLRDINDADDQARELIEFCDGLQVEVNIIPYNPANSRECYEACPAERQLQFVRLLREAGLRTSIRNSLGPEQDAACGQLTTDSR